MPSHELIRSLSEMHTRFVTRAENLVAERLAHESELQAIGKELQTLKVREQTTQQELYQILKLTESLAHEEREETLELAFQSLQSSQRALAEQLREEQDQREALRERRQTMLARDPELEASLDEYRRFEASKDQVLQTAPSYYRRTLEDAHKSLKSRIAPLLELEEALNAIPELHVLELPIALTLDAGESQLFLALPAASQSDNSESFLSHRIDAFENFVLGALAALATDPAWVLVEIERQSWAGFRAVTALAQFTGSVSVVEAIQSHLDRFVATDWPFTWFKPSPTVISLEWESWQAGRERHAALTEQELFAVPTQVVEGARSEDEVATGALFTTRDVAAWDRPLRVGHESLWTVTARRFRTLMIRLVAQGRIGGNGLPEQVIWSGLPDSHRVSLKATLPRLIEARVLCLEGSADAAEDRIYIDPAHLSDVQDLVNRDATLFWVPLIQESSSGAPLE